jgi:GT2 family glycosyltransferase
LKESFFPSVTIITVNYNGKKFLSDLFTSINNLNYPDGLIETIMVDNCSKDGSAELVADKFPWVRILKLKNNSGYAGGNNAGISEAKGEYIALINNDCIVDKNWLSEMVKTARLHEMARFAAVGSRVLFFYKYLPVKVIPECGYRVRISNISVKNKANTEDNTSDIIRSIKFMNGCASLEKDIEGNAIFFIESVALLGIPVPDISNDTEIEFDISTVQGKEANPVKIEIVLEKIKTGLFEEIAGLETDGNFYIRPGETKRISFVINKKQYIYARDIINSCGIEVNSSFYARDRGFENWDSGQFGESCEIFAPSGSSLLMSKEMLGRVGIFDRSFFTYYEDVDLFWRSRLAGFKCYYCANSVARHHHCGTSIEWSYGFTYHVLRNRLIMIYKCGWPMLFFKSYAGFVYSTLKNLSYWFICIMKGKKLKRPDIKARVVIFFELLYKMPGKFISRLKIRTGGKTGDSEIKKILTDF